jgi:hypothetical protein
MRKDVVVILVRWVRYSGSSTTGSQIIVMQTRIDGITFHDALDVLNDDCDSMTGSTILFLILVLGGIIIVMMMMITRMILYFMNMGYQ